MVHADDAALRLSLDGAVTGDGAEFAPHLAACSPCRARRDAMADDAAFAVRAFGGLPAVDAATAFARFGRRRTAAAVPWQAGLAGLALAAAVLIALTLTPLGGIAAQLLTVFQPVRVVPVEIDAGDAELLGELPQLAAFGTVRSGGYRMTRAATLAAAAGVAGFTPRTIAYPRAGSGLSEQISEVRAHGFTFTFDAAKAARYERGHGHSLPPMPRGLDGTTLQLTSGPAIVRRWGDVIFVESKAPRATSTGAGLEMLERYLLALPSVPPGVATTLRAIADPAGTLPIPLVAGRATASSATIGTAQAVVLHDGTTARVQVIWARDGMLYSVVAPAESEAIALARSVE